jgi:hypothetical protein
MTEGLHRAPAEGDGLHRTRRIAHASRSRGMGPSRARRPAVAWHRPVTSPKCAAPARGGPGACESRVRRGLSGCRERAIDECAKVCMAACGVGGVGAGAGGRIMGSESSRRWPDGSPRGDTCGSSQMGRLTSREPAQGLRGSAQTAALARQRQEMTAHSAWLAACEDRRKDSVRQWSGRRFVRGTPHGLFTPCSQ